MKFENAKALIADIDGTIVTKGEVPGPLTVSAMKVLHDHGVQLGIASGRVINDSLKGRHNEWNLPFQFDVLIGMNGGQVLLTKTGELYEQYALSSQTLREIMTWMKPLGLIASIYEGNHMVATAIDEMQAASAKRNHMEIIDSHGDIERLCLNPVHTLIYRYYEENEKEVMDYIHDYLNRHPDTVYTSVNTYPGIVEIIHKDCNKGAGVKVYCEKTGIPLSCTVGMGDMDNDIGLMSGCGIGVAMANGSDATKAAADYVTEHTCDDDGMGRFLFENWIDPLGWK